MAPLSDMRNKLIVVASCLAVLGLASVAQAYRPEVVSSTPRGMQRGTTQKVVLHGVRIKDGHQLLIDRPGIHVRSLKPVDDKNVELELEVPAETSPGLYPMRLVCETGLSNVVMFGVGTMPSVDEVEPNSDFSSPQTVDMEVTIEGAVAREDEDYFQVKLKQGQRLTAELEGVRLKKGRSNPFFDPYIAILNSERFELATSDDAPLLQQDCLCSIEAPEDGDYIILVRDSSFGGDNDRYRLHVGSFPRPIAVIPAGGPPGEVIDMTFISVGGEAWIEKVQLPSEVSDGFPLVVANEQGSSPSPNTIRVQPMPNVIEREPNQSYKEATHGPMPVAFCGIIGEPDDYDFFSLDAKKGQTLHLKLYAREVLRSSLDGVINVYNEKGGRVGGNDDSGGPDSFLEYKVPEDGKYHIAVNDHLRGGGPGYAYRLEVKLSEPDLTLTLPDRRRYEATPINVPKGNRAAVMINASRRGVGGPVDIEGFNLPEGVTLTPLQMPADQSTVPLLLSATSGAKLEGRLVNFVGRIPDNPIVGRFTQRHQLLIGLNNNVVYDYDADRAAVAVIEPMSCQIQIVQPAVPIVRNGSMDVTVKIDRGGLDADVPIRMLYNPPGIGSSTNIKIAKGEDQATIPLTANASAALGTWPLIAYASVAGNEIATEPTMVEIADKFFNFAFPKASAELGAPASVVIDVEVNREFTGSCELELLGLPAGVVCEQPKVAVTNESEQVVFPIKVEETARVGQHKTLVVRATISDDKGTIQQTEGTGVLQIDKPLPAPAAKPAAKAEQAKQAASDKPSEKKPLSRLEQLRLLHEQEAATKP